MIRPPSSTQIASARRTVANRCEMTTVVSPAVMSRNGVELRLAADVEGGGRLVEDQQPGAVPGGEQRPGQGEPLPLAAGQVDAAGQLAGEHGVPAVRQRRHDLGEAREPRRSSTPGAVVGVFERAERDVVVGARPGSGPAPAA